MYNPDRVGKLSAIQSFMKYLERNSRCTLYNHIYLRYIKLRNLDITLPLPFPPPPPPPPPSEIKRRNHSVRRKSSTWNGSRHYENSKKVHITWANFNERYGTKSRKRTEVMRIKTYVLNSDGYSQAKATNKLCRIIKSLHEKEMPMTASLSGFIH